MLQVNFQFSIIYDLVTFKEGTQNNEKTQKNEENQ